MTEELSRSARVQSAVPTPATPASTAPDELFLD